MSTPEITISMDLVCAAISMVGSLLVSRYDRWSYLGWACWLVANVAWIAWAFTGPTTSVCGVSAPSGPVWGVVLQNAFFFFTSAKGYLACRRSMKAAAATAQGAPGISVASN